VLLDRDQRPLAERVGASWVISWATVAAVQNFSGSGHPHSFYIFCFCAGFVALSKSYNTHSGKPRKVARKCSLLWRNRNMSGRFSTLFPDRITRGNYIIGGAVALCAGH
jgi:hypothetical protein